MKKIERRGGPREGAGRPKDPRDLVQIVTQIPAELNNQLILVSTNLDISRAELIRRILGRAFPWV